MYTDAAKYPQQSTMYSQQAAMYPEYHHGAGQYPGAPGNGQNSEAPTTGPRVSFMHHMFAERVPAFVLPSDAMVCKLERRQLKETSSEEILRYESVCGAQEGDCALPESRKRKETMRLEFPSEEFGARGCFEMEHSICRRISLDPGSECSSHSCPPEEVAESSRRKSGKLAGCVSELQQPVAPDDELPDDKGSAGSDRASDCFASPLSDLYDDAVPGNSSPTNSLPV